MLSVDNDPAKSDGRLQPGDEVIQVRGHAHLLLVLKVARDHLCV